MINMNVHTYTDKVNDCMKDAYCMVLVGHYSFFPLPCSGKLLNRVESLVTFFDLIFDANFQERRTGIVFELLVAHDRGGFRAL